MIRVCVVDDEPVARRRIQRLLMEDPEIEIVGVYGDGEDAAEAIRNLIPDLIFLDIQMPVMDGFEVLKSLEQDVAPHVIFITAYDDYAIRAFDAQAIDYLLKPFDQRRFRRALNKAKGLIAAQTKPNPGQTDPPKMQRLEIKNSGRILFVPISEICWIEAADQYADVHCISKSHLIRASLGWLEKNLDQKNFVRIHRSVIVNVNHVTETVFSKTRGRYLVLKDGKRLRISRRRLATFRKAAKKSIQ